LGDRETFSPEMTPGGIGREGVDVDAIGNRVGPVRGKSQGRDAGDELGGAAGQEVGAGQGAAGEGEDEGLLGEEDVAPMEADGEAGAAGNGQGVRDDPVRMDQVVRATAEGAGEGAAGAEEIEGEREGGAEAGALVGR